MSLVNQRVENFQNQQHCLEDVDHCNEEERELEEALSLSDLPINAITSETEEVAGVTEEENQNADDNLENDFDFGSLVGSMSTLDGEMCAADEVFSGGQILPYRNSVSSMSGLRSVSRSDSLDRRRFGSRCSSSRSSSIRSHYSTTSSSSCSSNNTAISAKTVPLVSKAKVQNQFHSYPSPKPQLLGSSVRFANSTTQGKKSKMWEVLKLGLVRTPEIELQDLKQRHRTNNYGKIMTIPRNNSTGSNSSCGSTKAGNNKNNDRGRKSCSNDGDRTSNFILEVQKRRNNNNNNQMAQNKNNGDESGFFKSCKCSIGAIEPMPSIRSNYNVKSSYFESRMKFGNTQTKSNSLANQVLNEDKNIAQKKVQVTEEQQKHQQQQRRNKNSSHLLRQGKQVMSHHHHHHRTFEWLKNLSHASVLNN